MINLVPVGWFPAPEKPLELSLEISSTLESKGVNVPFYKEMLVDALTLFQSPFTTRMYGDQFRDRACEPLWLARSIITSSKKEAEGAHVLLQMVGDVGSEQISRQILRHAVDESNHAKYYIQLLELTFPDCAEGSVSEALHNISPGYSMKSVPIGQNLHPDPLSVTIDELVQMNIGEIRTRIHQLLLWPVIAEYCPQQNLKLLSNLIATLIRDETRHISYTAQILEHFAKSGYAKMIRDLFFRRFEQFCELTRKELDNSLFDV
ncbi:MAG: hypothetical protein AAGG51_11865 [Cyanobacteria bacterium P01_G01_bin.54]